MAPSHLISAIEELAAKRREFTSAILMLASVAGVSAELYLAYDRNLTRALRMPEPVPAGTPRPAPELPPRPQQPASPSTNGTGRASKVGAKHAANQSRILEALKKPSRPVSPGELAKELKWSLPKLRQYIQPLVTSGQVKAAGVTSGRTFTLP